MKERTRYDTRRYKRLLHESGMPHEMNSPIHFCTGYLAGRTLGYREYRFETLYIAAAAYAPDLDSLLSSRFPLLAHGIWTHTLVGVAVISVILAAVAFGIFACFRKPPPLRFGKLLGLAFLGGITHLTLDAFTFYESEADTLHHMYFWPLWNFPWHINTLFPGTSYTVRVLVEVVYSIMAVSIILIAQWYGRGQNPFHMFNPRGWFRENTG